MPWPFVAGSGLEWGMMMGIIWTIVIGFLAGVVAKFISPGSNEPSGFILTTILGIIGAVVGAIVVLAAWSMLSRRSA